MKSLYVNTRGIPWMKHSYSAGLDFDHSPLGYYLKRILGWKQKDDRASFKFGRALEESIQFFHDHNAMGGVEEFQRRWLVHKEDKNLKYTKTEKDWDSLNRAGTEMMKLYVIRQPNLPIPIGGQSVFQREYSKIVFPGDENYGELEFAGKLDIVVYVDPAHPSLPKVNWKPEYGALRPAIIDIKTSALDFPESNGLAAYDKQLRAYSWLTGIRTAALLRFKKCGHNLSKGSSITMLEDHGPFKAGSEAVIAQVTDDGVLVVLNDHMLELMNEAQGRKEDGSVDQSKAAKQKKADWLAQFAQLVPETAVTRQRLQFNAGFITQESANDAGEIAARQMLQICNAWDTKKYPNDYGVRFPSDDRNDPYFRAFVLEDKTFRDENFVKNQDESIDDFFADADESED